MQQVLQQVEIANEIGAKIYGQESLRSASSIRLHLQKSPGLRPTERQLGPFARYVRGEDEHEHQLNAKKD